MAHGMGVTGRNKKEAPNIENMKKRKEPDQANRGRPQYKTKAGERRTKIGDMALGWVV